VSATTGRPPVVEEPAQELPGAWATVVRGLSLNPELRDGLLGTLALALIATAGRVVVPIVIQLVVDEGLGDAGVDLDAISRFIAYGVVAIIVTGTTTSIMNRRLATVVERALSNLRVRAFRHVHDLSMLHQASQQRGQLVSRVTSDIDEISRFMQWGGLNLVTSSGQLVVATGVMLFYSWRLTLVVLLVFLPFVFAARWFQSRLTVAYQEVRQRVGSLLSVVAETVVGAPVVRAYGVEERTQARLDERIEDHRSAAVHAGVLSSSFSGSGELFGATATAAVVLVGVLTGASTGISAGTVVAFLFLVSLFVDPVNIAMEVVNEAQTAVAGWRRVLDVLDVEPDVADPGEDGEVLPDGPLGAGFRSIGFRYPRPGETQRTATGPLVLEDVSIDLPAQTRVAVVGETGSGKTTFAKLLVRLMDPSEGEVLVAGVPLHRVRFSSLRRRVVMVPQEDQLFDGSITENVAMGFAEGDDHDHVGRVRAALEELGLADWVDELPAGLDTRVGERGLSLSAGERQLVALARAHVAEPDLLVLDEATSAVDPATEVRLQRALNGLVTGRTVVTIAHRLSTAEQADLVLVFDRGRLVQRGDHATLVAEGGVYGRLHQSWVSGQVTG
jgi:ABC-type multidrug transport system fused ATPase/permease subunit